MNRNNLPTRERILETINANNSPSRDEAYARAIASAPPHWTGAAWETHGEHMKRIGISLPTVPIR